MAATGFTHVAIAKCLGIRGIDEKTLRRHFRRELDTAADKATCSSGEQGVPDGDGW